MTAIRLMNMHISLQYKLRSLWFQKPQIAIVLFFFVTIAACQAQDKISSPTTDRNDPTTVGSAGIDRAIEIVQKDSGVYLYRYAETLEPFDPRLIYTEKYRIFKESVIKDLKNLIANNKDYEPEFKARCLPMWDTGLEFKDGNESAFFLFSFRCNTIEYIDGKLFKDFTPQRTDFYKIFQYEINNDTATRINQP